MAQKIVVTKAGYNALKDTDPTHQIFNSDYNSLKTVPGFAGTFQQAVSAGTNFILSFNHGLGYNPMVLAYFRDTADSKFRIVMSDPTLGTSARVSTNLNVEVSVDTLKVYFTIINGFGVSKTAEVFYEIFYEGV